MQTFLPYPNFEASARALDNKRLGKQRVEAFQCLQALFGIETRWAHHPAVQMWKFCEFKLYEYGITMCRIWIARGFEDNMERRFDELLEDALVHARLEPSRNTNEPWWLGYERLHLSHKSNLVRKMPEHYRLLWPDVPDDLPYVWPDPLPEEALA